MPQTIPPLESLPGYTPYTPGKFTPTTPIQSPSYQTDISNLPGYNSFGLPQKEQSWGDWAMTNALYSGPAILGGLIGSPLGPWGMAAGGAIGSGIGSFLGQSYEKSGDVNYGRVGFDAAVGAIPFSKVAGLAAPIVGSGGKELLKYGVKQGIAEGAGSGLVSAVPTQYLETGELPSFGEGVRSSLTGMGIGGTVGGIMGGGFTSPVAAKEAREFGWNPTPKLPTPAAPPPPAAAAPGVFQQNMANLPKQVPITDPSVKSYWEALGYVEGPPTRPGGTPIMYHPSHTPSNNTTTITTPQSSVTLGGAPASTVPPLPPSHAYRVDEHGVVTLISPTRESVGMLKDQGYVPVPNELKEGRQVQLVHESKLDELRARRQTEFTESFDEFMARNPGMARAQAEQQYRDLYDQEPVSEKDMMDKLRASITGTPPGPGAGSLNRTNPITGEESPVAQGPFSTLTRSPIEDDDEWGPRWTSAPPMSQRAPDIPEDPRIAELREQLGPFGNIKIFSEDFTPNGDITPAALARMKRDIAEREVRSGHYDDSEDVRGLVDSSVREPAAPTGLPDIDVTPTRATLPRDLKGASPRYRDVQLEFESDLDKAAYIIAQDKRSKRDADYLAFVMEQTGLDEASARALGQSVRGNIKANYGNAVDGVLKVPDMDSRAATRRSQATETAPVRDDLPAREETPYELDTDYARKLEKRLETENGPNRVQYINALQKTRNEMLHRFRELSQKKKLTAEESDEFQQLSDYYDERPNLLPREMKAMSWEERAATDPNATVPFRTEDGTVHNIPVSIAKDNKTLPVEGGTATRMEGPLGIVRMRGDQGAIINPFQALRQKIRDLWHVVMGDDDIEFQNSAVMNRFHKIHKRMPTAEEFEVAKQEYKNDLAPQTVDGKTQPAKVITDFKNGLPRAAADNMRDTRFILPDGTRLKHGFDLHAEAAESVGYNLDDALRAGVIRVEYGFDSAEIHAPITREQAIEFADSMHYTNHDSIHVSLLVPGSRGKMGTKSFRKGTPASEIQTWVNNQFRNVADADNKPLAHFRGKTDTETAERLEAFLGYASGPEREQAVQLIKETREKMLPRYRELSMKESLSLNESEEFLALNMYYEGRAQLLPKEMKPMNWKDRVLLDKHARVPFRLPNGSVITRKASEVKDQIKIPWGHQSAWRISGPLGSSKSGGDEGFINLGGPPNLVPPGGPAPPTGGGGPGVPPIGTPTPPTPPTPGKKAPDQSLLSKIWNFPTSMTTTFDLSAPLRQALPTIHTKHFWKGLPKMMAAAMSEEYRVKLNQELASRPLFQERPPLKPGGKNRPSIAQEAGIDIVKMASELGPHEENYVSKIVEQGPDIAVLGPLWKHTIGRGTRASNRAYTTLLNYIRVSMFEDLMEKSQQLAIQGVHTASQSGTGVGRVRPGLLGKDVTIQQARELNGYMNKTVAKSIGDFVNTATGRAPLRMHVTTGKELSLEGATEALSHVFFAPRNFASKLRMMNPLTYAMAPPQVRKEYIKSAAATTGAWIAMTGALKVAGEALGEDVTVEDDMKSADFGKVRVGNTRMDLGGGFLQYVVLGARMITGQYTSSKTGQTHNLGEGYQAETRGDTLYRFGSNKLNPAAKLVSDFLYASDYQKVPVVDRAAQMVVPLIMQDMKELVAEDPKLAAIFGFPILFGAGSQIYDRGRTEEKGVTESKLVPKEYDYQFKGYEGLFKSPVSKPPRANYWNR